MSVGLLERESTGGAIAREGFEYQDAYVLESLPKWLSKSAFSHVVSEAVGDVEVCYFGSSGTLRRVMYEAKKNTLSATAFWEEVGRFKSAHESSPLEFVRFVLVCGGYNGSTSPFVSKLERLRGVGSSYHPGSVIVENDRQDVLRWAAKNGYQEELANFALDHVEFVSYAAESADSSFLGELAKCLPIIDLSGKQATRLRDQFKALVARSSYGPVYRIDLETAICEVLETARSQWDTAPLTVCLLDGEASLQELLLAVGSFNGPARATKSAEQWRALFDSAHGIGDFVKASTSRRCVALDGKQRMSTACLLGYAFSATRGFTLQVQHNDIQYRTDNHTKALGTFFTETNVPGQAATAEGVACFGFPTAVGADIGSVSGGRLTGCPVLALDSARALDGIEALNLAVAEAKAALVRFRSEHRLSKIHLFIKSPSVFAMVLGHRLNGLCDVQLYDWVNGAYAPTALLDS